MRNALAYLTMRRLFFIAFVLLITHAALLPGLARADITHGLVGYWKLDEGTSSTAHDSSGNGSTGTVYDWTTDLATSSGWVAGKVGSAMFIDFNQPKYVWPQNPSPALNLTGPGTVSAWIKLRNGRTNSVIAGKQNWNNDINGYLLGLSSSVPQHLYGQIANASNASAVTGVAPVPLNTWVHVAFTWDGTTMTLYYNGAFDNSAGQGGITPTPATSQFLIGMGYLDWTNWFDGTIDDVRVYNRALSAADVAQLYKSQTAIIRKPANMLGMIAWWKMDEGTSTIVHDSSGLGHNGTLTTSGSTLPQWVSGKFGKALLFDGSSNYVNTNSIASSLATGPFTISLWFKPSVTITSATADQSLFEMADASSNNDIGIFSNRDRQTGKPAGALIGQACTSGACTQLVVSQATSWTAGVWYHVVYTFSVTSGGALYVNGVSNATDPGTSRGSTAATKATIGQYPTGGWNFNGTIDDVRVYNRALSPYEVANLYQTRAVKVASAAELQNGSSLQQGLVGYWTFDGKDTRWTSPTSANLLDASGNNRFATTTNMAQSKSTTIGKLGQALKFDGVSAYVSTLNVASSLTTGPFTISMWFKLPYAVSSASPGPSMELFSLSDQTSGNDILMALNQGTQAWCSDGFLCAHEITDTEVDSTQSSWAANTWYHVVFTLNTTAGQKLYVNGALSGSNASHTRGPNPAGNSFIGGASDYTSAATLWPFNGTIDDVRIYNRALTDQEIKQLYKLGQTTQRP